MPDLGTTNTWLAVLAGIAIVQTIALTGLAIAGFRAFSRMSRVVDDIRGRVDPLASRAAVVLDDAQQLIARLRETESTVRDTVGGVATSISSAGRAVQHRMWPVLGVARGLRAALSAVKSGSREPLGRVAPATLDSLAESRFTDEGGPV